MQPLTCIDFSQLWKLLKSPPYFINKIGKEKVLSKLQGGTFYVLCCIPELKTWRSEAQTGNLTKFNE